MKSCMPLKSQTATEHQKQTSQKNQKTTQKTQIPKLHFRITFPVKDTSLSKCIIYCQTGRLMQETEETAVHHKGRDNKRTVAFMMPI